MDVASIGADRIQAMMAQLKSAATKPVGAPVAPVGTEAPAARVDFADALKNSLEQVSAAQAKSSALGKAFSMGDDSVSLSDVMIAMQKSSINFQATVQVRNKLVSAYQEIMNMQV